MKRRIPLNIRILITGVVTLLVWAHIAWDYFNGGIPTHYILHDENMPGLPNWLGGIILPFFTWIVLSFIRRGEGEDQQHLWKNVILRGMAGILFSVGIAVFFTLGSSVTDFMMLALFLVAFFLPLYKPEYLLGYVLGAAFTFGAMIPMIAGPILLVIVMIFYKLPRWIYSLIKPKTNTNH